MTRALLLTFAFAGCAQHADLAEVAAPDGAEALTLDMAQARDLEVSADLAQAPADMAQAPASPDLALRYDLPLGAACDSLLVGTATQCAQSYTITDVPQMYHATAVAELSVGCRQQPPTICEATWQYEIIDSDGIPSCLCTYLDVGNGPTSLVPLPSCCAKP